MRGVDLRYTAEAKTGKDGKTIRTISIAEKSWLVAMKAMLEIPGAAAEFILVCLRENRDGPIWLYKGKKLQTVVTQADKRRCVFTLDEKEGA